eukprot:609632-Pyramimonas_sp.AAC.1
MMHLIFDIVAPASRGKDAPPPGDDEGGPPPPGPGGHEGGLGDGGDDGPFSQFAAMGADFLEGFASMPLLGAGGQIA